MSHSFNFFGKISDIRESLHNDTQNGHAARVAKAVINADLDMIEAAGGTHAEVSAYGSDVIEYVTGIHKGSQHGQIYTTRDVNAEAEYAEEQRAKKFDDWYNTSIEAGHIVPAPSGNLLIHIPQLATTAGEVNRIHHDFTGSPNVTDGAASQAVSAREARDNQHSVAVEQYHKDALDNTREAKDFAAKARAVAIAAVKGSTRASS